LYKPDPDPTKKVRIQIRNTVSVEKLGAHRIGSEAV
jgi:hypothetical protein